MHPQSELPAAKTLVTSGILSAPALDSLYHLRILDVTAAGLNRSHAVILGRFLESWPSLDTLILDDNALGGNYVWRSTYRLFHETSGIEIIAGALHFHPYLQTLSVRCTGHDNPDRDALARLTDTLTTLQELRHEDHPPSTHIKTSLPKQRNCTLPDLKILFFSDNKSPDHSSQKLTAGIARARRRAALLTTTADEAGERAGLIQRISRIIYGYSQPSDNPEPAILFDMTKKMVDLFVPTDEQTQHNAESPQTWIQQLQSRAGSALLEIAALQPNFQNSLPAPADWGALTAAWAGFIGDKDIFSGEAFPLIPDSFRGWFSILISEYTPALHPAVHNKNTTDHFRTAFIHTLHPLWSAAGVTMSSLIHSDRLSLAENIAHDLKIMLLFGLCQFSNTCARTDIFAAGLETPQSVEKLAKPRVPRYLSDLWSRTKKIPADIYQQITGKTFLNTEEKLRYLYTSFKSPADFADKMECCAENLIFMFGQQIKNLDNRSATLLGAAIARHLATALMAQVFIEQEHPLSLAAFTTATQRWVTYIPMEFAPLLTFRNGETISADVMLRFTPIRCSVKNTTYQFQWRLSALTPDGALKAYFGDKILTFSPAPYYFHGSRPADEEETAWFAENIWRNKETVALPPDTDQPFARMVWAVNEETCKRCSDDTGPAVFFKWKTNRVRIRELEEKVEKLESTLYHRHTAFATPPIKIPDKQSLIPPPPITQRKHR